jgi:tetratricopeptide (TPR) repeat protein
MKRAIAVFAVLGALAACGPNGGVPMAQLISQCEGNALPDQRLSACSTVIADAGLDARQRAAALVQRGRVRAELGDHSRAVADFGRALRLDRTLVDAYVERGAVHQQRGAYERAVRDYDAALAIDPNISLALDRRSQALAQLTESYQGQVAQLTEQLARTPNDAGLLNNRCWVRAVNGEELDAALADCNAALLLENSSAQAFDSRGLVHLKRGAFGAAFADYEAALAVEPGRGHFLYGRGLARLGMGQTAEAQQDFLAAEVAEPGVGSLYASYRATPAMFERAGVAPPSAQSAKP